MTEVIMPKMGDAMEEGTLVEWLKKEGEKVKSGEVIGTIQTDKATLELESPGSGILSGMLIHGGETVPVGKPIAAVLKEGEALPQGWGNGKAAAAQGNGEKQPSGQAPAPEAKQPTSGGSTEGTQIQSIPQPQPRTETAAAPPAPQAASTKESERIKASPLAKRIAAERGIDLTSLQGSGPGGRIVEKDVIAAKPQDARQKTQDIPAVQAGAEDQTLPLNKLRQITAERTTHAKQNVPHFYVTLVVNVEPLMRLREQFETEGGKVSINDFVMRACVLALLDFPAVNSTYQGQTALQFGSVHLGMAVAIESGLTVPVIKNAETMTLRQLSARAKELAGKARENRLHPDELSGSTFTISNMGMLQVDEFIAIINEPNAAILAVSSVKKQVVATEDDEIEIQRTMSISGSFDHRVVDGAIGAKFMNIVRDYLEHPTRLLS